MELACLFSATIDTPDHCARAEQLGYSSSWVSRSQGQSSAIRD